jgi:hypothetical protein
LGKHTVEVEQAGANPDRQAQATSSLHRYLTEPARRPWTK